MFNAGAKNGLKRPNAPEREVAPATLFEGPEINALRSG
jgi:hypothetical protein